MVEADHMTPDEVIEWLEAKGRADMYNSASPFSAAAQTVRAMRDENARMRDFVMGARGLNEAAAALRSTGVNVSLAVEIQQLADRRSSLSPKEGKT